MPPIFSFYDGGVMVVGFTRTSKRKDAVRNKTALGPRRQDEISFKIEDLSSNKTTGKLS
jgi:hypothetical protein